MVIYDNLEISTDNIQEQVIKLLELEGDLKATLYYKLEQTFCGPKSKFKLKKSDFFYCLIRMMEKKKIDIIIPELFEINWENQYFKNLNYLQDGYYFFRKFSDLSNGSFQSYGENRFFFDSRLLNFNFKANCTYSENILASLIKRIPMAKNKIIVYCSSNSMPLNIYEKFEGTNIVKFLDFKTPSIQISSENKIAIKIEKQESDLRVIKTYRTNYMCMYITLIESIHKAITNLQSNSENVKENDKLIHELIEKFGYYCYLYVKSDWIDVKPSPYKWESFFNAFGISFKVLELTFKNIKFYGRTFEFWIVFRYCMLIKREFKALIDELLTSGFEIFESENTQDSIAIGIDHEIFLPCPAIEYFYFTCKYIFYYHAFYLFNKTFSSIEQSKTKFTEKERNLFVRFLPIMNLFFGVSEERPIKKLVFKFYTFDPEELETIYNSFLLENVREIETKMFNYFLIKYKKR